MNKPYIKEKYNVNVNLIKPSEISEDALLKNDVNYIIGFELTDLLSEIGMGKGNQERYDIIQKNVGNNSYFEYVLKKYANCIIYYE